MLNLVKIMSNEIKRVLGKNLYKSIESNEHVEEQTQQVETTINTPSFNNSSVNNVEPAEIPTEKNTFEQPEKMTFEEDYTNQTYNDNQTIKTQEKSFNFLPLIIIIMIVIGIFRVHHIIANNNNSNQETENQNVEIVSDEFKKKDYTEEERQADLKVYKDNFIKPIKENYRAYNDTDRKKDTEIWFKIDKNGNILDSNWNSNNDITTKMVDAIYTTMHVSDSLYVADYLPESYDKDSLTLNLVFTNTGVYYKGQEPKEQVNQTTNTKSLQQKTYTEAEKQADLKAYKDNFLERINADYPNYYNEDVIRQNLINHLVIEVEINKDGSTSYPNFPAVHGAYICKYIIKQHVKPLPQSYDKNSLTLKLIFDSNVKYYDD